MTNQGEFSVLPISQDNPDIDILTLIEEEGASFFLKYIDSIEKGTERDKFYYKSYIINSFFENLPTYSEVIWKQFVNELLTNKEAINLICHLHSLIQKKKFIVNLIKYYKGDDIHKLLLNDNVIPYFSLQETDLLTIHLNKNKLNLKPYIKCQTTRLDAMEWLLKYYDENKRFKSLMMINVIDIYNLDKIFERLINITMQLLDIFMKGITEERICKFELPTSENFNDDHNLKFINKYFFMLNNYLEISVINLIDFKEKLVTVIEDMQFNLDNDDVTESTYSMLMLKLDFFKSLQDKINGISYNQHKCFDFYRYNCVVWLNHISNQSLENQSEPISTTHPVLVNDLLNNTIDYLISCKLIFDKTLFDFCMKILNPRNIMTTSVDIRSKVLMLLDPNYDNLESNLKKYILDSIKEFVSFTVDLFNSVVTIDDYDIYMYQLIILKILSPYKQIIFDEIEAATLHKFIYLFLDTYESIYKGFINNIQTIYKFKSGEEVDQNEQRISINKLKTITRWYQKKIFIMDEYINLKDFQNATLDVGNRDKMALILGFKLFNFTGKDRHSLNIHEPPDIFKPITHLQGIFNILYSLKDEKEMQKALANEQRFLKVDYLEKMVKILDKNNLILRKEYDSIISLKNQINSIRSQDEIDENDIPEDLLDPIMGTLIENPVLLPNSEMFMEYDVILRHLLTTPNNPFTRDPLSKDELDEYNARPEIQEKVGLFKQRLCNKR